MAINFNEADEQRESAGAIPAGSMVKVRMTIRQPEAGSVGTDQMLKLSKKGDCEMLDCEFEVVSGQFVTRKIWNNFIVDGSTDGHCKAAQISMRVMRAIVEAVRGISPKDTSPAATQGRVLNSWADLQGMEFGVVVGVDQPKPGDRYVNNTIKRVITADDEQFQHIMAGGEIITDAPLPEIPQAGASTAAPSWAAPRTQAPAAPVQGTLPAAPPTSNNWQAPPVSAGTPPPPAGNSAMPAWAAGQPAGTADDIPF
ncbi:MAG: hypothetical protein AB7D27_14825 [Desulfomicrobium sp.]